jgi:hypothetical protein
MDADERQLCLLYLSLSLSLSLSHTFTHSLSLSLSHTHILQTARYGRKKPANLVLVDDLKKFCI